MRKLVGIGVIAIVAVAVIVGIMMKGPGFGGGSGAGSGTASGNSMATEGERAPSAGMLTVTIQGEQYFVEGSTRSLEEVLSAAAKAPQGEAGPQVLVKIKGNARVKTVEELDKELARRGIRYVTEEDF